MSEYNDETLTEDIRSLAQVLLDDPVLGKIMRDAAMLRNLTLDEEKQLLDFAWKQPFMQRALPPKEWGERHIARAGQYEGLIRRSGIQHFNPFLAAAVARNVVKGNFSSVEDSLATVLIEQNKVPGDYTIESDGGYVTASGGGILPGGWQPRKLTFAEVYDLLKTIWPDPAVKAAKEYLDDMLRKTGSYDDREFVYPAMRAINNIPARVMYNRGWSGDPILLWVIFHMIRKQTDINDEAAVKAEILGQSGSNPERLRISMEDAR